MSTQPKNIARGYGGAFTNLVPVILAVPVVLGIFGAGFVWLVFADMEAASVDGPAPAGSFAVRRDWGEQNLGEYLLAAENWIRKNENIKNDIGEIVGVAPIGGPNRYCDGFGECWASMNLQVIGTNGEGTLQLSELSFSGGNAEPYVELAKDEPWSYQIHESKD